METLITSAELPRFVPGDLLHCSDGLGWKDLSLRSYRYRAMDVAVPALADFTIVAYRRGRTPIERRFEGKWTRTDCAPGDISLLSRCQPSHWHWTHEIDVTHAYLSEAIVSRVAADVLGRPVAEVRLRDLLRAQDPMVTMLVEAISREAGDAALGGALYVEALSTQLVVHLLRHHATIAFRDESQSGRLSAPMRQRLIEYVEVHLEQPLTLEELARVAGIGVWSFGKRFRASFETTPHHYVIERRVERARQLLTRGQLPLKAVACACGFSDQAHMTRVMRARLGTTPAALRRDAGA